jgi:hypothetical protein
VEEKKVAVGLWPVESANVSRQWRAAFSYKTFYIKPIEKTGRPNTWLITAEEGRLFTISPQLSRGGGLDNLTTLTQSTTWPTR